MPDNSKIIHGDCRSVMPGLERQSFDLVFADPPYPCIQRKYGTLDAAEWAALMDVVMIDTRRLLKPSGSAVFVLQPNSSKVGSLRPWLWEFLARWTRRWNMVQDVYWWNLATPPSVHTQRRFGLMRPSMKLCAWFGEPDCYRNQDAALWTESERNRAMRAESRAGRSWCGDRPNDQHQRYRVKTRTDASEKRGGVVPFNVIPMANTSSRRTGAGHEGQTPEALTRWWLRYACPTGGRVLDPFAGTGTTLRVASELGLDAVGIEKHEQWHRVAEASLDG